MKSTKRKYALYAAIMALIVIVGVFCLASCSKDEDSTETMTQETAGAEKKETSAKKTEDKKKPQVTPQKIDIANAIREVQYAYYMRGDDIQYNSMKRADFAPEDATSQNTNYIVCSGFTYSVYKNFLDINIPLYTDSLIRYSSEFIGNKEVIGYGKKANDGGLIMKVMDPALGFVKTITNPSLSDIVPLLKVGDVLTYTGHTIMVYDLIYDKYGDAVDAVIIQSGHGAGRTYVKTKVSIPVRINSTVNFGSGNLYLYHNNKTNKNFADGRNEGSLNLQLLSEESYWKEIGTARKAEEYSINRFLDVDENGYAVLNYQGAGYYDRNHTDEYINLPENTQFRVDHSRIFIEKTVSVGPYNDVKAGDKITYTILVKNNGKEAYKDAFKITETVGDYVTVSDNGGSTVDGKTLTWEVPAGLAPGASKTVKYSVTVNDNNYGKMIYAKGFVGGIPSSTIENHIGYYYTKAESDKIVNAYNALKGSKNGKTLINEIYKKAFGKDLGIDKLDLSALVQNTKLASESSTTLILNKSHALYKAVLGHYYASMCREDYTYDGDPIYRYTMKLYRDYTNADRRADTVYADSFRTGDILIYKNTNDVTYSYSGGVVKKNTITYEDGEYAYIFIEGKGFVGVNLGADNKSGTKDDRNEFNSSYYTKNDLSLTSTEEKDKEFLEFANYQTLLGKDSYVILRPALLEK